MRPTASAAVRPYAAGAVPLPTGTEAAAFDHESIRGRGVPEQALMESAGRAAAAVIERCHPAGHVVALVGAGNNGGDALVVARTLAAWGRSVEIVYVADRGDDREWVRDWPLGAIDDQELSDEELERRLAAAGVVVDGVLGTGIVGPPRPRAARVLEAANRSGRPIVSLDVPSGVDADTGRVPGVAARARETVAFGWPKLGTLLHPARGHTGRLIAVEIGFPPAPAWSARLLTPGWADACRPERDPTAHKNTAGSLLVIAGRAGMAGAAVLAVRAALRAGAGFVRVASASANREILQEAVPDAPFVPLEDEAALAEALEASAAVAAGPGLGTDDGAVRALAGLFSGPSRPTVLDADALNMLAAGTPRDLPGAAAERSLVVTPHPGEMARLVGRPVPELQQDRPGEARALAAAAGCVVVLKGAPTLVAEPDGGLWVAGVGGSELATAGMGDVLTGAVGALLAQGVEPTRAAGLALVLTARAARLTGLGAGLTAGDIPDALPEARAEQGPGDSDLGFPCVVLDIDAPG